MSLSDQSERPRLLVVDDDPIVRLLAQSVLAAAGFVVTDVADGASALEVFARRPPDIVLLDVLMPGMNGFEVCTELRRDPGGQHTPVMMLTGLDDVESINHAYEAGATEFVTKPINWLLLSHRLRYMLRASRALADRRRSEATKEALLGAIPDMVLHLRSDGMLLNYKPAHDSARGKAPEAAVGLHLEHAFPAHIASRYLEQVQAALRQHGTQVFEYADGSGAATREYEARLCPSGEGEVLALVRDISERRRAEQQLRKLSAAVEQSTASIIITDVLGRIEYVNPRFYEVTGYAPQEVLGSNPCLLKSGETPLEEYRVLWETIRAGGEWHGIFHNRKKSGELYWETASISPIKDAQGRSTHFLGVKEDITERKRSEAQIRLLAYYDRLTGLPNRLLFQDRLIQSIAHAQRHQGVMAVLILDLDQFKRVNDTLGHRLGDLLLQGVAARLSSSLRSSDSVARLDAGEPNVARLGGDEFAVLLIEIRSPLDAGIAAQRLLQDLARPFDLEGYEAFASASIGIGVYPHDGQDAEELLKNADAAMYSAKDQGRNRYQFYSRSMNATALRRFTLEAMLHKALERDELVLHYQPQFHTATDRLIGVEALIRWRNPELGMISPMDFIPLAEDSGLIVPIGEWVLRTACSRNQAWQAQGFAPIRIAVNLSARQFARRDLARTVEHALAAAGLDAEFLELEITESTLMQHGRATVEALQGLSAMGIRIAIDDFGTGYSSLSYLKRFHIDTLKIDQSFLKDIPNDRDNMAIVQAIIAIGHSLKLEILAEGVETEAQRTFLRQEGCDLMQGYLLSRPLAEQALTAMMLPAAGRASAPAGYG